MSTPQEPKLPPPDPDPERDPPEPSPAQDIKTAGGSAKTAVLKTGTATGKATVNGVKATGRGIMWAARKIALGTGSGIEKSGAALKSVGK